MKKIYTTLLIAFSMYSYAQILNTKLNEIHYGESSSPSSLIKFNDQIIFSAERNTDEGRELWAYNLSTQKSTLLKDILPGHNSGMFSEPYFGRINNKIYFIASDNSSYNQIWVTDGTVAGTQKVKDLSSNYGAITQVAGNKLFIFSNKELSVYDPANNTLTSLKTFEYTSGTMRLETFNNQLFLAANDGVNGKEVWKSDGTIIGTTLLKDIAANSGNGIPADFKILALNNGKFYFVGNTGTAYQLYESDGTTAGTNPLMPVPNTFQLEGISAGNYFVFIGFDAANGGFEPWISDGTVSGTKILKDIIPGTTSSMGLNDKFLKIGNKIYFDSNSNGTTYGNYIWETDGTTAGTTIVNTPTNNMLYGTSSDGQHLILTKPNEGSRYWIKNGNSGQIFEIIATGMPYNNNFIDLNSKIYLTASNTAYGSELFSVDPSTQVVAIASDITHNSSSSPHSYELLNDNLIFIAANREFNNQFYKRDKNTQQITRFTNFTNGSFGAGMNTNFSDTLFRVGNFLYTKNNTPNPVSGFYRTDGTSANSIGISTGNTVIYDTSFFANLNDNTLLFSGYNNVLGTELWKIDNNSNTFSLVKDISTESMGSMYNTDSKTTVLNGFAYFVAKENGKLGIWKSDGTEVNTTKAIQLNFQDGTDGDIKVLGNFNSKLLFTSRKENSSNSGNSELYASNGDQASAILLKSHNSSFGSAVINRDTEILNNKLFYFVTGYPSGVYSTDGTVVGTTEVYSGGNFFGDIKLKKCGNQLFFTNNNSTELWKTNGTATGTASLGANFSAIKEMACVNNYLYFLNDDSQKIWRSNGTSAGTVPLDIFITNNDNQLLANENILKMATDNEKLFLTIYTKDHGNELYTVTDPLPIYLATNEANVNTKNPVSAIQVYPNPVSDNFSLKVKDDYKIEAIKIFDASGKQVKNIIYNNDKINVADLSSGIYFLKIKTDKGEYLSKIIKK
ncbi:ELWxxDGT repeat protein [Chryseobacterium ginsenosidimutans]|uniref:T9SS type A sorting domain-containing protein n=1 Tax=Chryseobacterium ginsenosidimutans TaxID=687846 RepID=UPI002789DE6D|nr:T9SS type A sorting domain-containing protein [Chryseobacterium ginsenosidimutans]MDQ0595649.1 ELWxxDGT repeat protein [Chryseobacterium ginsenosidimutans]